MKAESSVPTSTRPVSAEDLARLRHERDEADRASNDALTVLMQLLIEFEAQVPATESFPA